MGAGADVAERAGGTTSDRGDGKVDRRSRSDENERPAAPERVEVIASVSQLTELLPQLESIDRVAVDTEADSLHCYREKLCLLQVSLPGRDVVAGIGDAGPEWRGPNAGREHRFGLQRDYVVDPLADVVLEPSCVALDSKEVVFDGEDCV